MYDRVHIIIGELMIPEPVTAGSTDGIIDFKKTKFEVEIYEV